LQYLIRLAEAYIMVWNIDFPLTEAAALYPNFENLKLIDKGEFGLGMNICIV